MEYDVAIIGAGMSGLAAGIRLALFDKRVCIIERHTVHGGLNSFYTQGGRQFDVGLHAVTNYVSPEIKNAPLPKVLRQLRIPREAFDLCEQTYSSVCFPDRRIRFNNHRQLLIDDLASQFPDEIDSFLRLVENIPQFDQIGLTSSTTSARKVLGEYFKDPTLIDMLLCPLMFYGNAWEHDMDWTQFAIMFRSIYLEGFSRPRRGCRKIISELVKKYRQHGGEFRMSCKVRRLISAGRRVTELELDNGESLAAGVVLSSAGYLETLGLLPEDDSIKDQETSPSGKMTFVESISVLDVKPAELGQEEAIIFFNDEESFTYARPEGLINPFSGVICCPNNYLHHESIPEGMIRLTSIANYDRWVSLSAEEYAAGKEYCYHKAAEHAVQFIPDFRERVIYRDIFTPCTIEKFTGHLNGAVYGCLQKLRDGRTHLDNLFLCGTDQGFVGIIGALMSGISMANLHVLSQD